MTLRDEYLKITGEKWYYTKLSKIYHTKEYVKWLETKVKNLREYIKEQDAPLDSDDEYWNCPECGTHYQKYEGVDPIWRTPIREKGLYDEAISKKTHEQQTTLVEDTLKVRKEEGSFNWSDEKFKCPAVFFTDAERCIRVLGRSAHARSTQGSEPVSPELLPLT